MKYDTRQLPFAEWPEADRIAWENLFADGDIFDDTVGQARHWRPATRKSNRKHYGCWLGWLIDSGRLEPNIAPHERVTPENVRAFAADLMEGRSKRTVATYLIGLKCVLIKMAPDKDWQWLRDLTNRLDVWAGNPKKPYPSPLPASRMFAIVLGELERLKEGEKPILVHRLAYRDTLIIGFLLFCPVRLINITEIEIGAHLREAGSEWLVSFESEETKNSDPLTYVVPEAIVPYIQHYVAHIRPGFGRLSSASNRLWLANKNAPLADNTLYQRIVPLTKRLFGAPISPQQFRAIAATFLSESSAADALRARSILGHRRGDTTANHYIRASTIEASRKVAEAIKGIGGLSKPRPGTHTAKAHKDSAGAKPVRKVGD